MTDQRDPRIRALIVELSESSPEAPTFAEIEDHTTEPIGDKPVRPLRTASRVQTPGWSLGTATAAALVVLLLVGGPLLLLTGSNNGDAEPLGPADVETTVTAPPTTIAVDTDTNDWLGDVQDVAIAPDGSIFVAAVMGVASLDASGEWTLVDLTGLPEGAGLEGGLPGRVIDMITVGPNGELWVAGMAESDADDEEFGGIVSEWSGGRILTWIARHDCDATPCSWQVFTSDDIPDLASSIGDIAVSDDGTVYAPAGENLLLVYDGVGWESHTVAGFANVLPWSGSIAVTSDGAVWAGTNGSGEGRGLFSFDSGEVTHHTTANGLPSDSTFQVAAATDGSIWVATDASYNDQSTASPDAAAGVARYDGTDWTTYTMDDGLLSNDAFVATGPDGTVWAIHSEIPPYGYARFDGTAWTAYPTDQPVGGFRSAVDANGTLWMPANWTAAKGDLVSFDGTTRTTYPSPFTRP